MARADDGYFVWGQCFPVIRVRSAQRPMSLERKEQGGCILVSGVFLQGNFEIRLGAFWVAEEFEKTNST